MSRIRPHESEEWYRTLFEQNPLPMWVFDLDSLQFLAVNEAAVRHYGYSLDEFLSMTLTNIRPEEDIAVLLHDLATIPERGSEGNVRRHKKKDGSLIQVEVYARDLVVENRRGRLVLANDVTAQKVAEEQVRKLNDEPEKRIKDRTAQLEAANQELESFSYSVSHDLRAPLRHIDAFSRMLAANLKDIPEQPRLCLQRIGESVRRMNGLIEDLLALGRVGRQGITFRRTALSSIVSAVIEELRQEDANRSIEWRTGQLPSINCDPLLMRQVFRNLLDNAVKFTRQRPNAVVEIGAITDGGQNIVYIRDNGVGFNMKYVGKLFGVFERLHRQEDFEGTGVGLAIVQRIIRRHGGRVWAEAELNKGATFYLAFGQTVEEQP